MARPETEAQCLQCTGEGKTNLWRFGRTGNYTGCEYSSYNSCLKANNPKNINVTTLYSYKKIFLIKSTKLHFLLIIRQDDRQN